MILLFCYADKLEKKVGARNADGLNLKRMYLFSKVYFYETKKRRQDIYVKLHKTKQKHHKVVHTTCILYHDTTVCARNRLHLYIFTEMTLRHIELKN